MSRRPAVDAYSFADKHFHHIWAFVHQFGRKVDGRPLVAGVNSFNDILEAFGQCAFQGTSILRLSSDQVRELDTFTAMDMATRYSTVRNPPPSSGEGVFQAYAREHGMEFFVSDYTAGLPPSQAFVVHA